MELLLLFPNQIFALDKIDGILTDKRINQILLLEHPIFFGLDSERNINFNKMKLVLHRACMYYYNDYLKYHLGDSIKVDYQKVHTYNTLTEKTKSAKNVYYIDVPDHLLDKRMKEIIPNVKKLELNPNFILTREHIDEYLETKKGKYFHKHFYEWSRRKFDILMEEGGKKKKPLGGKYSYDQYNRAGPPSNIDEIPSLPELDNIDLEYIEKAKREIEKEFSSNYGSVELYVPVTFEGAKVWLEDFIQNRLANFGLYEDAVMKEEPYLYHSVLSPLINCGLLSPTDIILRVLQNFDEKYDGSNQLLYSTEGFIRQILGWREWQRMLYLKEYDILKNSNYYEHDRALTEAWYNGTTGVEPIDDTIKYAYKNAYLHHILRLMYMSNFMNLCRIHPHEMYYWFMSFSMDSYDWVMIQNVYAMGAGADGGFTMTKPYVTTGNYISKMSNYGKKGDWVQLWGDLYYNFISINEEKLQEFPRVSWMMLKNLSSKTNEEMKEIKKSSDTFIKKVTKPYKKS